MTSGKIAITAFWLGCFCCSGYSQSGLHKKQQKGTGTPSGNTICHTLPGDFKVDFNAFDQHQVDFTNTEHSTSAVSWDFGDGATDSAGNFISHVYGTEGVYSVTLVAKNNSGCLDTTTKKMLLSIDTGNIFLNRELAICKAGSGSLPGDVNAAQSFWSPVTYLDLCNIYNPLCSPVSDIRYKYNIVKAGFNLANNGNFSYGNSGFFSKYVYDSVANGPGHYFISAHPRKWNSVCQKCPYDTINSPDTVMIVHGSTQNGLAVWSSKINVIPNTNYAFSFMVQSLTMASSLTLEVSINNGEVIGRIAAPDTPCISRRFTTTWFSDTTTNVMVRITDLNTDSLNNNFQIDSISFRSVFLKTDSLLVSIKPLPVFSVQPSTAIICNGDSVLINASGGDKYSWYPAATVAQPGAASTSVFPSSNTTYKIVITEDACNIRDSVLAKVYVLSKPTVTVSKSNDVTCTITQSTLNATGGTLYQWQMDSTLSNLHIANPIAMPYKTTIYLVQVTDENGCKSEGSIEVKMLNADSSVNDFLLPTAFTPNNDGLNDRFSVHRWGYINDLRFSIYNRWGKLIFYTSDTQKGWDGTCQGMPQPAGTYVYVVQGTTICGYVARKGTVVLLR